MNRFIVVENYKQKELTELLPTSYLDMADKQISHAIESFCNALDLKVFVSKIPTKDYSPLVHQTVINTLDYHKKLNGDYSRSAGLESFSSSSKQIALEGIGDWISRIWEAIKNFFSKITNWFKDFIGISTKSSSEKTKKIEVTLAKAEQVVEAAIRAPKNNSSTPSNNSSTPSNDSSTSSNDSSTPSNNSAPTEVTIKLESLAKLYTSEDREDNEAAIKRRLQSFTEDVGFFILAIDEALPEYDKIYDTIARHSHEFVTDSASNLRKDFLENLDKHLDVILFKSMQEAIGSKEKAVIPLFGTKKLILQKTNRRDYTKDKKHTKRYMLDLRLVDEGEEFSKEKLKEYTLTETKDLINKIKTAAENSKKLKDDYNKATKELDSELDQKTKKIESIIKDFDNNFKKLNYDADKQKIYEIKLEVNYLKEAIFTSTSGLIKNASILGRVTDQLNTQLFIVASNIETQLIRKTGSINI